MIKRKNDIQYECRLHKIISQSQISLEIALFYSTLEHFKCNAPVKILTLLWGYGHIHTNILKRFITYILAQSDGAAEHTDYISTEE